MTGNTRNAKAEKRARFDGYRRNLEVAGITTSSQDSLVCPLCWQETRYDGLTLEHIVPRSVGGTQTVLTCRHCNSRQGHALDAHLAQYQKIADVFQGHGTLQTKVNVNDNELVANLKWGEASKNFVVVGKATNPAALHAIQRDFARGNVSKLHCTLFFRCRKNSFQTAVLRAAYLVLFKCFGYAYVRQEIVQLIRRRIADPTLHHPRLSSLVIQARDFEPPYDAQHYVVPGNVNGVQFFLVIIRVRRKTTTYLGAYLPVPADRCHEFFDLMEQCAKEHNGKTLTIPAQTMFG